MSYDKTSYDKGATCRKPRPLMVGCSGGGGHNAAIKGVQGYFAKEFPGQFEITLYKPVIYRDKPGSPTRNKIDGCVGIMHAPVIGTPVKAVVSATPYPVLPDKKSLQDEITALSNKEEDSGLRPYIDMLLDVYPAGYESAAIWNVLQRNDKTAELKKLIDLQNMSDKENYDVVLNYFTQALETHTGGTCYTEIISTQAMALPALCDAVISYNSWLGQNPEIVAQKVVIHQYMTDLPTKGAVHFFNSLSALTPEQQKQMKLYGVGMNQDIINHFFPDGHSFNQIYDVSADKNPMVRPGFTDKDLNNSVKFDEEASIKLVGQAQPFIIAAKEQIASIMLGSQASNDTVEYIETLLKNGMKKVFVLGGTNPAIKEKIEVLTENPNYAGRIICLGNQGDKEIAALMSRSNMVIIRGGGLSVMEQLCMQHNSEQTILIHHADSPKLDLTSGISWEDDNVKGLITNLRTKNVHVDKTSPKRAVRQIAEARLIAAVKRIDPGRDIEAATRFIKKTPDNELHLCVENLKQSEQEQTPSLPPELITVFDKHELSAEMHIRKLNDKLIAGHSHLTSVINEEIAKLDSTGIYLQIDITSFVDLYKYDVNKIVKEFDEPFFKDASLKLASAVKSYRALEKLQAIISDVASGSMDRKLINFKNEYDLPETRKGLMAISDGIFTSILKTIELQLAKYFPGLGIKLSFQQDIKKHMSSMSMKEAMDIPEPVNESTTRMGKR